MVDLNFAIIGCGNIAPRHAENIVRYGKLQAVCDIYREKADKLAGEYGCKAYYSLDDLLDKETNVSIVVVCTPNGLHAEHSIKSLHAGRHVICEKPMCISTSAAWSMRDTAHFFRRHLFIIKQNRFDPPVAAVKKLLDNGHLGKIVSVQVNGFWNCDERYYHNNWKGTREPDGGILYTQFSHFIDIIYWFFGDIKQMSSYKKDSLSGGISETEDNIVTAAELENGALCTFHFSVNTRQKNMEGSVTILGEKGTVKIGGQNPNTITYQQIEGMEKTDTGSKMAAANDYSFYRGSMSNHDKVYENIVAVLNGGKGNYTNAEDGLRTVAIIEKIYSSCQ